MYSRSIKTRVTVLLPVVAAVVSALLLYLVQLAYTRQIRQVVVDQQQATVAIMADEIDRRITSNHNLLITLAKSITPAILADPDAALRFLELRPGLQSIYNNGIYLFDRNGRMIAELPLGRSRYGMDFSFRDYLRETYRRSEPVVSAPYVSSQQHHHPALMFTAPVKDRSGAVIGVLGGGIDLLSPSFLASVTTTKIGKNGYMYLIAGDRTMVLHPDSQRIMQRDVQPGVNTLLDRALAGYDGTDITVNSRNIVMLSTVRHLRSKDWVLGANYPVDEAYAPLYRSQLIFAVTVIPAILLSFWLLRIYLRHMIDPLLAFGSHVVNLGSLYGNARIFPATRVQEVDVIGAAFNTLIADLDRRVAEVQHQEERSRLLYEEARQELEERKRLEAQLRHAQRMDAIGQLASGVAHDFNNILTAIIGYASVLQLRLPHLQEQDASGLNQLLGAAERGAELTRGLLAFSRNQPVNQRLLDLNEVVRRAAKLFGTLLGEDVQITLALSEGRLPVCADSGQLEQVLMNLATNARDAMSAQGMITISTTIMEADRLHCRAYQGVGAADGVPYALLTVTDTGTGMDEETVARVFEPFFTTKEVGRGTGLGLAITYGIVKQHGGFICCRSSVGQGASFVVGLPLAAGTVEPDAIVDDTLVEGDAETILIAEDDPAVRSLTKRVLEDFGYVVLEARNGAEAIERYREHAGRIGLVLMDLVMPGLKAKELLEQLRRIEPDVRILACSGHAQETLAREGWVAPDVPFIAKPYKPGLLLRKIKEALKE